jgi:hypothetical protein
MRDVNSLVATVFSGLSALTIDDVADDGEVIWVLARTRDAPFPCPMCGIPTGKVHGYHVRTVADVPVDAAGSWSTSGYDVWSVRSWAVGGRPSASKSLG